MNFREAYSIAYENMNPYDDKCDEDRCVIEKTCPKCNPEWEQELEYLKEYTGDEE